MLSKNLPQRESLDEKLVVDFARDCYEAKLSGSDMHELCTLAGYEALRGEREFPTIEDLKSAKKMLTK